MSTTLATLDQSFYQQFISQLVGLSVRIPQLYNLFVYVAGLEGFPAQTYRNTWRNEVTNAEPIAELAVVPDAPMTDEATEISVGTYGRSVLVSDEVRRGGTIVPDELARGVFEVVGAHRREIDRILWVDVAPTLTNESGDELTPMTFAQHISFGLELDAQVEYNRPVGSVMRACMHKTVWQALVNDMNTTEASIFAATFGSMNAAMASSLDGAPVKQVGGIEVGVTDRIQVVNVTGRGNVYAYVGSEVGSCFFLVVKWGIGAELRGTERQLARRVLGSMRIGVGVARQDYGLEAITAAA